MYNIARFLHLIMGYPFLVMVLRFRLYVRYIGVCKTDQHRMSACFVFKKILSSFVTYFYRVLQFYQVIQPERNI